MANPAVVLLALLAAAPPALAQIPICDLLNDCLKECYTPTQTEEPDPFAERLRHYRELAEKHRLSGLASYYSSFFDGRKTANGEIFRNRRYSAAHLTLPLGTWIEVTARATGKRLRLRVNDRGPYARKFMLDLSQAAARFLGVDAARDRHVEVRVIALPGEEPLPEPEPDDADAFSTPES